MYIKKVMPKLGALIVIALLASGGANAAQAAGSSAALSGNDVLDQAVALYEKLHKSEVVVPEQLLNRGLDEYLLKSVVLGYVNLDDAEETVNATEVRKQDVMTILYKTIINYDSSYAISEEEANEILNDCYDNAYIDAENKIAYAFMIRQGIISGKYGTEPNKPLTWDSCRILVDLIYDYFIQEVTVTVNDTPITIGSNVEKVLENLGEPNRIDKSDYGFEWYIYNTDYKKFVMVGVEGDRVCALYTNANNFSYNGIQSGEDYSAIRDSGSANLKFTEDENGKIDSVLYNPRSEGQDSAAEVNAARGRELLDIINAFRVKRGLESYVFNQDLSDTAWLESVDYMVGKQSDNTQAKGYDIYEVYKQLVQLQSPVLTESVKKNTAAGISTPVGDDEKIYATIITKSGIRTKRQIEQVDPAELPEYTPKMEDTSDKLFGIIPVAKAEKNTEPEPTAKPVEEVQTPQIKEIAPDEYGKGDDIVLDLKKRAADQYHLEVYDIESEDYLINSYISTADTKITVPSELLTEGLDYTVTLSSVTPEGDELAADEQLVSYGSAYDTGVTITGPAQGGTQEYVTDSDYIALEWDSKLYHDFYVDVYNTSGGLVLSTIIEDDNSALIQGLDPGEYYVYVTALRRGTIVEKAQAMLPVKIEMPQPVINEYILDKDDKYYFVYEDEALGVLYFYDEELVNVEENGETVTKKKIIQKQVKSTKAYRNLAQYRSTPEYTTGDPTPHVRASEMGQAIVDEAKKYMGVPYVWGGTTPSGFDCSGLVQYVCNSLGISVSRVTYDQVKDGVEVPRSELSPGDLVFFSNNGDIHHVGIYIGNDEFIHAPRTGDVVKISSLNESYYAGQYCGARRVY